SRTLFLPDYFRRGRARFPADATGAGLDLATISTAAETGAAEERDLRMRRRIDRRSAGPIPIAVLFVLHHFPHFRRGSGVSGAVRGGIHRIAVRRLHRDPGFSLVASRGTRLGVEQW